MNELAPKLLSVEQFIDWALAQPSGRYELEDGRILKVAPERVGHIRSKYRAIKALEAAILASAADVFPLTDGATVGIGPKTAYEPDAMVYAGPELPGEAIELTKPIIVVEGDGTKKLANYFKVESIQHYLIVDPENRLVVHHRRGAKSGFETEVIAEGPILLDPPGLTLPSSDLFPPAPPP